MGAVRPLTLVVTGATGFIGRHVVAEARARGHIVRAVVRPGGAVPSWGPGVEAAAVDLAAADAAMRLGPVLEGADVVIHAATALSGDAGAQAAVTEGGTRALCAALASSPDIGVVLVSSISVYDTAGIRAGAVVTEDTPLAAMRALDGYARGKLAQEGIARKAITNLTILRPGAVFGPGRLWNAHIGVGIGPMVLRLAGAGQVPLSYVDHCAEAIVLAAERRAALGPPEVINVIDDDLPDAARYLRALARGGWPRFVLPVDWRLLRPFALVAALGLGGRAPGLLRPGVLRARMLPRRFDNARLHQRLGWAPRYGFEAAMARALAGDGNG